jgi:hypothetical protein
MSDSKDIHGYIKKFNELFLNCIDLFAEANNNPFVSLKLAELKRKTNKAIASTSEYAILRIYKEIIAKKDKITSRDEKYFLTEDCKSFVATMAMKYTENYNDCMRLVGFLRDNYKGMPTDKRDALQNNIVQMLGCSAEYALRIKK